MAQKPTLRVGDHGFDGSHEFVIAGFDAPEVCIEYLSDGKVMWVQSNRIETRGGRTELV